MEGTLLSILSAVASAVVKLSATSSFVNSNSFEAKALSISTSFSGRKVFRFD